MKKAEWRAIAAVLVITGTAFESTAHSTGSTLIRVVAVSAAVRTGPGGGYSRIGTVHQGQVLKALDRSPEGDWYRIELWPGTTGWVFSEFVWPMNYDPSGLTWGPSAWPDTAATLDEVKFGLTLSAGTLAWDGWFSLKFSAPLTKRIFLELSAGQSAGKLGRITNASLDITVVLIPWRFLAPFVSAGAGTAYFAPHSDTPVLASGFRAIVDVGGGLMSAIYEDLLVRVDAARILLFDPEKDWSSVRLGCGVTLLF